MRVQCTGQTHRAGSRPRIPPRLQGVISYTTPEPEVLLVPPQAAVP